MELSDRELEEDPAPAAADQLSHLPSPTRPLHRADSPPAPLIISSSLSPEEVAARWPSLGAAIGKLETYVAKDLGLKFTRPAIGRKLAEGGGVLPVIVVWNAVLGHYETISVGLRGDISLRHADSGLKVSKTWAFMEQLMGGQQASDFSVMWNAVCFAAKNHSDEPFGSLLKAISVEKRQCLLRLTEAV